MSNQRRDPALLKQRLSGRWLSALCALAPALTEACQIPGRNVRCPIEGKPQGFRLFRDANQTGGGCKQNTGCYPDGISLLMSVNGWNFVDTFDALTCWLDGASSVSHTTQCGIPRSSDDACETQWRTRQWLRSLWTESVPIDEALAGASKQSSSAVSVYLRSRRIRDVSQGQRALRAHPDLAYYSDDGQRVGSFPALLALVCSNEGLPVAIHRTWLNTTGVKLMLNGQTARKLTAPVRRDARGRVVRLAEPGAVLGIAEGLETALSVIAGTGIPTWACVSASFMASFVPPLGVKHVMIFADKDRSQTGETAAWRLHSRLEGKGIDSSVHLPQLSPRSNEKGVDFADQWTRNPLGFASVIEHYQRLVC